MDQLSKIHLGLDVHKDSITIGRADPGREPARVVGKVPHDVSKLLKLLGKQGSAEQLHLVYEAGPTGFGLQHRLSELGYCCEVIAPSKMPRKPGVRVKTDGRDAMELAQASRAGDLCAVWVPDAADEAIRDLSRVREDAVKACTQAKQQLGGFLLRRDLRFEGKSAWTKAHFAWLAQLKFDAAAAQVTLTEYLLAVQAAIARVQRLDKALVDSIVGWRFESVVAALQALRGVAHVTAIGLVAEIGTCRALSTRASSWPTWAWCPRSIQAASAFAVAASPRRATRMRGACSPRPRGAIAIRRASVAMRCAAKTNSANPCARWHGRPNCD